jgi:hypothetical protein
MKKVMSILAIFCFLFVIGFVLAEDAQGTNLAQGECVYEGGTWTNFTSGCADTCAYVRALITDNPLACTQAITDSCDCGPDKCWNGHQCEDNVILVGGCGTVTPGSENECCVNLGYNVWDVTLNECVNTTPIDDGGIVVNNTDETPIDDGGIIVNDTDESKRVCCKIYGLGAEMVEVNVRYEFILEERCSVPEDFVGGNREIVENSLCKQTRAIDKKPRQLTERERIKVQQVIQTKNRLEHRIQQANGTCPDNCTCTGSVIKCTSPDGNREMIIRAGKSGNTIVQVKNVNMSTMVHLFRSEDGEVFGVFKGNKTKKIVLPDKASEVAKQRLQQRIKQAHRNQKRIILEDEEIELNEDGYYEARAKKKARLFWIVPVREKVRTQIDAETGVVIKQRHSWWGFLARDLREDVPENETTDSSE